GAGEVVAISDDLAVALGLGALGSKNRVVNEGSVTVIAASGSSGDDPEDEKIAAVVQGGVSFLEGDSGDVVPFNVSAALGMGVAGYGNRAVNEGHLSVLATSDELAVAAGMAGVGEHNWLINEG